MESPIKGYHAYMKGWEPEKSKLFNTRLDLKNIINRFAVEVEKESQIVGHLSKGNQVLYFICANHGNICQVEVREKRVNLGDEQGPLYSSVLRRRKHMEILKNSLPW